MLHVPLILERDEVVLLLDALSLLKAEMDDKDSKVPDDIFEEVSYNTDNLMSKLVLAESLFDIDGDTDTTSVSKKWKNKE